MQDNFRISVSRGRLHWLYFTFVDITWYFTECDFKTSRCVVQLKRSNVTAPEKETGNATQTLSDVLIFPGTYRAVCKCGRDTQYARRSIYAERRSAKLWYWMHQCGLHCVIFHALAGLCITASLIILNWVTPVCWWQMVQQNNASHLNAVQYSVTEPLPCMLSGTVPFLGTEGYLHKNTRILRSQRNPDKWADLTSLVCFVLKRYSVWESDHSFLCNTTIDYVSDSKH